MIQQQQRQVRTTKVLGPGEGEVFTLMGIRISPKLTAEDTAGAYTLLEQTVAPQAGSPPHICHRDDKTIYVVEGEFAILVGNETRTVTAGGMVYLPKGTVHNFKNIGNATGKILVSLTPGGHEKFLRHLSQIAQDGTASPKLMAEVSQSYGVEMVRPAGA